MKILIVDDHALIREALRGVLRELDPNAAILEASTGAQAIAVAEEHIDLSLTLLDIGLPDGAQHRIFDEEAGVRA